MADDPAPGVTTDPAVGPGRARARDRLSSVRADLVKQGEGPACRPCGGSQP